VSVKAKVLLRCIDDAASVTGVAPRWDLYVDGRFVARICAYTEQEVIAVAKHKYGVEI